MTLDATEAEDESPARSAAGLRGVANRTGVVWPLAAFISAVGFLLTFLAYRPGIMTYDSFNMWNAGGAWRFDDHHHPLIGVLLALSRGVTSDPSAYLGAQLGLWWGGAYLFAVGWRAQVGRWAVLAALLGFLPFNLSLMGYIHKTPLLTACFLCSASLLFVVAMQRRRPTLVESAVLMLLVFVGAVVRGYSLAAALPIIFFWAWLVGGGGTKRWDGLRRSSVIALGIVLFFAVVDRAIVYGLLDARRTYKAQIVFRYDMAAIHAFTGRVYAEAFLRDAYRDRRRAYRYYLENKGLWRIKDMYRRANTPESVAVLRRQWGRAIVENPRAYLVHRRHAIALSLGVPGRIWNARRFEVESPQNISGLRQPESRVRELIRGLQAWARNRFFMLPWFWAVANVCLSLTAALVLRGGRRVRTILPHAVMLWSGLLLLLPYLLVCLDHDARFTYWVTVSTSFGGLGLAGGLLSRRCSGDDSRATD